MNPKLKLALAAALAALATAGCAGYYDDRPFLSDARTPYGEPVYFTRTAPYRDTYIPQDGTAPYRGVDPYYNNSRFGPVTPE